MADKPRVIIRRTKEEGVGDKKFRFGIDQVRKDGFSQKVRTYRQKAWEAFCSLGLPDPKSESWRRSNLKDFHPDFYKVISEFDKRIEGTEKKPEFLGEVTGRLELGEKNFSRQIDEKAVEKGVVFLGLYDAEVLKSPELDDVIGTIIDPSQNIFTAAAGAFARYGSVICIPEGLVLEKPLNINLNIAGEGKAFFSHHLIHLQPGSQATIILENSEDARDPGVCFHSGLVEIKIEEGAQLNFVELQSMGQTSWNFGYTRAILSKDAALDWTVGTTGARFTKNFSSLKLTGEGSHSRISGFYFSDKNQLIDHETEQDHLAPHTTSDLLFKGALKDESQAVWRGMIYVAPQASKTDGYQANRNLILSDKAKADSIPGLEILTDDVRCTHGATVGRIDQEQVFYLESRGIPRVEAEKLVVEGFFESVLDRIPLESIRDRFRDAIKRKMSE